jgi:thioredoxin reductase (NADPH)
MVIGAQLGGAMAWASEVENYPGFEKITGLELANKMVKQAKALGGEIKLTEITNLTKLIGGRFDVQTGKENYQANSIIIATGTKRQELGIPGEKEYLGRGVSYCTTCDAAFFKDKIVAVVGGANAAVVGALHLAKLAKKVYLIYRKKPLRADPIWVKRVTKNPKIEIIYEANLTEILGNGHKVTGIGLDKFYQNQKTINLEGVFIEIGGLPGTDLTKSIAVELDEKGFVKVNPDMSTNIPGVFAAGDIANLHNELQQIVTACAEGAIAAHGVYKYLQIDRK